MVSWGVVLLWLLEHYTLLGQLLGRVLDVLSPFIAGIALAFLLNLMMNSYERHLLKPLTKYRPKLRKAVRPAAIVLTLVTVAAILSLLLVFIIPQLGASISEPN